MASLHLQVQRSFLSSFTQKLTTLLSSNSVSNSPFKVSFSLNQSKSNAESSNPTSPNSPETTSEPEPEVDPVADPVKLAFEKAKAYKKLIENTKKTKIEQNSADGSAKDIGIDKEVQISAKVAMEKAREYKKNKGVDIAGIGGKKVATGSESNPESSSASVDKNAVKKDKLSISSIDFMGLDFADKKTGRGLPPGLAPVLDPFPEGDLPEVEIIVGDTSKFDDPATSTPGPSQEDNSDVYKPKVSTWGVFPRPGNISKTFGGGRTIRPGDVLETAEERAAKDKHTKQLLAAYRKKMGLTLDPKLKFECEKFLKDGDSLMDSGKLKEALPYYQMVMDKLPFHSELHGLAALQWSICQDSLSRRKEARTMYEKLQSHQNARVSKKARQFLFSFQAMEMMKVTGSNFLPESTGYQNYFEAFMEEKSNYTLGEGESAESAVKEALPYMLFLVFPIIVILSIALVRGNAS